MQHGMLEVARNVGGASDILRQYWVHGKRWYTNMHCHKCVFTIIKCTGAWKQTSPDGVLHGQKMEILHTAYVGGRKHGVWQPERRETGSSLNIGMCGVSFFFSPQEVGGG